MDSEVTTRSWRSCTDFVNLATLAMTYSTGKSSVSIDQNLEGWITVICCTVINQTQTNSSKRQTNGDIWFRSYSARNASTCINMIAGCTHERDSALPYEMSLRARLGLFGWKMNKILTGFFTRRYAKLKLPAAERRVRVSRPQTMKRSTATRCT